MWCTSATRHAGAELDSGVVPQVCVRVYTRVCWCLRICTYTIHVHFVIHTTITHIYIFIYLYYNDTLHTTIQRSWQIASLVPVSTIILDTKQLK